MTLLPGAIKLSHSLSSPGTWLGRRKKYGNRPAPHQVESKLNYVCPTRSTEAEELTMKLARKPRGAQHSRHFPLPALPTALLPQPRDIQVHREDRVPTRMPNVHPGILKWSWKSEINYKKKHVEMSCGIIDIEKKCLMGSRRCF